MSWMNRLSPPEPDYSDTEWDQARDELFAEWEGRGWPAEDAAEHIDDWMVAEQCEYNHETAEMDHADAVIKRRKEGM